jgi:simple sugar transport system substrate-binding protein
MFRSEATTVNGSGRRAKAIALVVCLALALTACSSQGGKQEENRGDAASAGRADTPRMKIAMITHAAAGDTFWDIIRKGADAAAAKDNVELNYTSDTDGGRQATLVQNAIDSKVDGIAITLAKPDAMAAAVAKAKAAGIPVVAFNGGIDDWQRVGAVQYFGSDEKLAGEEAGRRVGADGGHKVLCVIQEQGHVALEARCAGVKRGLTGGTTENLYVTGTSMPSVRSTIEAKLKQDKSIDYVVTLGAPFALTAIESVKAAGSNARVATFDTNKDLMPVIKSGAVQWAIDQQPYLQGYLAVDSLWLYKTNGNVIGGGRTVATGPYFIDKSNVDAIAGFASKGTR